MKSFFKATLWYLFFALIVGVGAFLLLTNPAHPDMLVIKVRLNIDCLWYALVMVGAFSVFYLTPKLVKACRPLRQFRIESPFIQALAIIKNYLIASVIISGFLNLGLVIYRVYTDKFLIPKEYELWVNAYTWAGLLVSLQLEAALKTVAKDLPPTVDPIDPALLRKLQD